MGKNEKTLNRKRGRSVKGKRALEKTKFTRGAKHSLVAALDVNGIVSKKVIKGAFDFEHFWNFIFDCLVLEMTPYPGPNSVMVLDNARIHHNEELRLRMEMFGLKVIFLPAYSPDFNPIEFCFSQIKSHLKRNAALVEDLPVGLISMEEILEDACNIITSENAMNFMDHCGYRI
jgi:transposase